MKSNFAIALRVTVVTLVVTGLLYPITVTGLSQVLFPSTANGSFVVDERGQVVGSERIAQAFSNPGYFQPRPSAAGDKGFDALSSSGSNFGPTSAKLKERIQNDLKRLQAENQSASGPVPAELVTASGSGLDPHISPEAALWQLPRVAKARGVSEDRVRSVVTGHVEPRELGFLGEPRVNVLLLNNALDRQFGQAVPLSRK
jgi:K+-transporting ATPase ATPase C chain